MSIEDYNNAVNMLRRNQNLSDFIGECSKEIVKKAEEKLNIVFPQSYRNFLLNFGAGNFGAEEIYGIVKEDFENSGIPDAVWFTLKQRKEVDLPLNLIVIYHTGGEEMFCIDINKRGRYEEPAVVSFVIGVELKFQKYDVIANDFGEFLLQRINLELGLL